MNKYKTLEEFKEELGNKTEEYMYKANIELLTKIDKAIEYVSNKKAIINTDVIRIFDLFEIDEQGYIDKLLEILKGDSNE